MVLYDDGRLLAVDKPAGVVVHPSGRYVSDTLIQRVHARYGGGFELEKLGAPRLCHRLDGGHDVLRQVAPVNYMNPGLSR